MKPLILNDKEVNILHEIFFPTGNVLKYDPNSKIVNVLTSPMRRYILDSNHTKKLPKSKLLSSPGKFDCNFLSYGFFETLNVILERDFELYFKIFTFFDYLDQVMSNYIVSTVNKTVLFSNNKFGEKLFTHIHLDNEERLETLSLFFRLTRKTQDLPKLILYDNLSEHSRILTKGYMDFKKLTHHEKTSLSTQEIEIKDFIIIKFNASIIPHSFTYNEDLWVTMVYDHAELTEVASFQSNNRYSISNINTYLEEILP